MNEFSRNPTTLPYLRLPVLCCIMQGGPSPGVPHNGGTHQQQPVEDGCVTAPGCKVEGRGPLIITSCQADVGEGDLGKEGEKQSS